MTNLHYEGFTQNREISWLRFNERVLMEGADETVPLLERLRFVRIFMSNLDEFFMIRAGSLIDMQRKDDSEIDERSGLRPSEQLSAIYDIVPRLYKEKDIILTAIEKELAVREVFHLSADGLSAREREQADRFYRLVLEPVIKPSIITPGRDFPFMDAGSDYLMGRMDTETVDKYAFMLIPDTPHRILIFDDADANELRYIRADEILAFKMAELFEPFSISELVAISLTRNAEVDISDGETFPDEVDQRVNARSAVRKRHVAAVDHVDVRGKMSRQTKDFLCSNLKLDPRQIFITETTLSLEHIEDIEAALPEGIARELNYGYYELYDQTEMLGGDMIEAAKNGDILSAYPYDSMSVFLRLLEQASMNESVSEIRMTIYRLADHAEIADYLMRAARNGIDVKVLIELRARFDEENNIDWARRLDDAGCHVFYGDGKYKIHSKICQILLDDDETKYITQVGTGNYNEITACQYTDLSLITYDQELGRDISLFFNDMIDGTADRHYRYIMAAPSDLRNGLIELIDGEIRKCERGRIFIKVNSLTDGKIIEKLSEASCAGVQIRMIVRGICCILPHVEFCTENIDIVNVVGRYLEHSRVYVFGSGEGEKMYISSADLMTRNTVRRFELACPVYDAGIKKQIKHMLYLSYHDDVNGRRMTPDGHYERKENRCGRINSQEIMCAERENKKALR